MKMKITDWPEEERPRERLFEKGTGVISDTELMAIIIGNGVKGRTAIDLSRELLAKYGSVRAIATKSASELSEIRGIGRAKAIRIIAAFEISRRLRTLSGKEKRILKSPEDVANYYIPIMQDLKKETFRIILLDSQGKIIKEAIISEGSLSASIVHPREVFRAAIIDSAAGIILVHNHPSGDPRPSEEDLRISKLLVESGKILNIRVHDHIIIGDGKYLSLSREGCL